MPKPSGENAVRVLPAPPSGNGTLRCACCHLRKASKKAVYCGPCTDERADPGSWLNRRPDIGKCCA